MADASEKRYGKGIEIMIQISKEEALWFVNNTKAQWRNGVSTSHSRNKKYYLVEKPDWVKLLSEKRNAKIMT